MKARSEALWHLQGFIPRNSPSMMGKLERGEGVPPPYFCGSPRMMGKSKRGDTIHPSSL